MINYDEIRKNRKLTEFPGTKEAVISNYTKNVPDNIPKCKADQRHL